METVTARGAGRNEGAAAAPGRGEVRNLIPSQNCKLISLRGHPEGTIIEKVNQVIHRSYLASRWPDGPSSVLRS